MDFPTKKTRINQKINQCTFLFYGDVGIGKTTFVNQIFDRVLFASTDRGTRDQDALRVEVHTPKKLDDFLRSLPEYAEQYDAVCFDHIDDICVMIETKICNDLNVPTIGEQKLWGKGWALYRKEVFNLVQTVLRLGLTVVFIAHETKEKVTFRNQEIDRHVPRLSKAGWDNILPVCTFVGYCTREERKIEGKFITRRYLYSQPTQEVEAKDRTGRTQPENGIELMDGTKFRATFTRKE